MVAPPTLHYRRINNQRQFDFSKFNANLRKSSSPKLLKKILSYCTQISPRVCEIQFCLDGDANYSIGETIAKENLNLANFMQTL